MADFRITDLTTETNPAGASDYVEIDKAGYPQTKKITVNNLTSIEQTARAAQDDVIEAAGGLKTDGTYGVAETTSTNTWYLRQAEFTAGGTDRGGATGALTPSLKSADRLLDMKLKEAIDRIDALEASAIYTAEMELTNAQIMTLNSVPISFSITPPADNFITVLSWEWKWDRIVAAYATNTNLLIRTLAANLEQGRDTDCLLSTIERGAKGAMVYGDTLSATTDLQLIVDNALEVTIETGDPTGGNAANVLRLYVTYKFTYFP